MIRAKYVRCKAGSTIIFILIFVAACLFFLSLRSALCRADLEILTSPFRVNTYTSNNQLDPVVGMNLSGDFVMVWASVEQDGDGYGIYGRRYNKAGVPVGAEFRVNNETLANQSKPSLVIYPDGNFTVAWEDQNESQRKIYLARFDSQANLLYGPLLITSYSTVRNHPQLTVNLFGNIALAWGQDAAENLTDIYAQLFIDWYTPSQTHNNCSFRTDLGLYNYSTIQDIDKYIWCNEDGDLIFAESVNLSEAVDLNPIIHLGRKHITVNSSAASYLNKTANITFYDMDCNDPDNLLIYYSEDEHTYSTIASRGVICPPETCSSISCLGGAHGNLSFQVSHFTGFAAGPTSNLTIYDDIEYGGEKMNTVPIMFYAKYLDRSDGTLISGAICNISFEDNPTLWFTMTEGTTRYHYNKTDGFASAGEFDWAVNCSHPSHTGLLAEDNITIFSAVVPEFFGNSAAFALIFLIAFALAIRIKHNYTEP